MKSLTVILEKGADGDSYAIRLPSDPPQGYRAEKGYGSGFEKVWTVDLQSEESPDLNEVNWDAVLDRVVEAYTLSDPVITNFIWPQPSSF